MADYIHGRLHPPAVRSGPVRSGSVAQTSGPMSILQRRLYRTIFNKVNTQYYRGRTDKTQHSFEIGKLAIMQDASPPVGLFIVFRIYVKTTFFSCAKTRSLFRRLLHECFAMRVRKIMLIVIIDFSLN